MIKFIARIFKFIFTIIFVSFFIVGLKFIFIYLGLLSFLVPISGNSMNPTLLDKQNLPIYSYNQIASQIQPLQRGDMVAFKNDHTHGEEYIKRIIALPGDTVNLSNGYVSVNGQKINEQYILQPHSTFGGEFLSECRTITVPDNQVFVLGDNRKRSLDSREIGFVSIFDIQQFLPFKKQQNLAARWRDTSNDFSTSALSIFDTQKYYQLLNDFRQNNNQKVLKIDSRLEKLAYLRAQKLVQEYNSASAKSSDAEYQKDISSVGYSNIINQEISTFGFYEAGELMDYWQEKKSDNVLLNKEFTDTGIASIVAKVDGCEVQIVVQEFGGYRPPSYSDSEKQNINQIVANLQVVQSDWQKITTYPQFYSSNKKDIDRLLYLINYRLTQYQGLASSISANKWFSTTQKEFLSQDKKYHSEQEQLANNLNDKIKRENSH